MATRGRGGKGEWWCVSFRFLAVLAAKMLSLSQRYEKKFLLMQKKSNISTAPVDGSADSSFLLRALDLAYRARGRQSPNPPVGAVIVRNGRIIGEGYHRQFGGAHAEINAIESVDTARALDDATLYVSLEPCFHYGKTPPCVDAILARKFRRVVIGTRDINPLTAGRSVRKLQTARISVREGVLRQKALELIRAFRVNQLEKRPYVLLKYAVSADGYFGSPGRQVWLSNPFSMRLVHLWRSKFDAILVGANTVRTDNPRLSTRYFNKISPLRVILTTTGKLQKNAHIFDNNSPTIIATPNPDVNLSAGTAENWILQSPEDYLRELLERLLAEKNTGTLMIEGGRHTLQQFIDAGLWDEAAVIRTPVSIGDGIPEPHLKGARFVDSLMMAGDRVEIFRKR